MLRFHPAVIVAALGLAAVSLLYATSRTQSNDTERSLKELMQSQAQILHRLDQLEANRFGNRSSASGAQSGFGRREGFPHNEPSLSLAQLAMRESEARRDRESKFVSEPLSAAWAASTERTIGNVLSAMSLAKEQATPPTALESKCHSQTCRISMSFADESTADFTKVVFLDQVAGSLPQAEIFQESLPDGSFRYLVYARTSSAARSIAHAPDKN